MSLTCSQHVPHAAPKQLHVRHRNLTCHYQVTLVMMLQCNAGAGHVRAAAATAIAFLACHPIGAKGDDCMWGPYREVLLQAGALEVLLEAALAPTQDESCRKVIEKAAAVGIMYLCTVVCFMLLACVTQEHPVPLSVHSEQMSTAGVVVLHHAFMTYTAQQKDSLQDGASSATLAV